jgi:hypothetical protein
VLPSAQTPPLSCASSSPTLCFLEIKFIDHKIHPFKVYNLRFLVYLQSCATVTTMAFQNIPNAPQDHSGAPLAITPVFSSHGLW